jgi:uncharacterized protein
MQAAEQSQGDSARTYKGIVIFVGLAFLFSIPGYCAHILIADTSMGRNYTIALMWAPGLAALATIRLTKDKLSTIGWQWGDWRWNVAGYIIPIGYSFLAYAGLAVAGIVSLGSPEVLDAIIGKLGFSPAGTAQGTLPTIWTIAVFTLVAALPGIAIGVSSALGEEIGWRGYLVPKLMEQTGFWGTSLISGVIWGIWHMPILLLGSYNNGTEWWYGMTCFAVLVLCGSMFMTWLRLRSDSVWPCAIYHASHNLFIQIVFSSISQTSHPDAAYYVGEFGAAAPLAMLAFSVVLFLVVKKSRNFKS